MKNKISLQKKYQNVYVNFAIILLIMFFSSIIFRKYIFQGYPFLSQGVLSDLLRVNLPVYIHLFDSICQGGFFWSWSMGIGTSMFAHADVYFDPFTYICLLGGRDNIAQLLIWSFVIKLVCEGIAFSYYARYFGINSFAVVIASVMYSFCGYSMIMGGNFALGTILVYFPLTLLAIEKKLDNHKYYFLLLILFSICIYSYYYFYVVGVLASVYLTIRCVSKKKKIIVEVLHLAFFGIVVLMLSAFTILPQLYLTLGSSRLNAGKDVFWNLQLFLPDIKIIVTAFVRSLGLNFLGNGITTGYYGYMFGRETDYFSVECYVTALSFPLLFQYFHIEKNKSEHVLHYCIGFIIMVGLPFISYILNAFSTVNYRWIFIIHLLICLMCAFAISKIIENKKVCLKTLIISEILSIIGLAFSVVLIGHWRNINGLALFNVMLANRVYFINVIFIYFASMMIAFIFNKWGYKKEIKNILCICLVIVIFMDVFINYYKWYGSSETLCSFDNTTKYGYDDCSSMIIKNIRTFDTSFYRIYKDFDSVYDKNNTPSDNDALAQQYYGLKSYCSLNNANYITFLQKIGVYVAHPPMIESLKKQGFKPTDIKGAHLNYINGIDNKYQLLDYFGVKYYLSKTGIKRKIPQQFVYAFQNDDIDVFVNKRTYPLAFINNKYMNYERFIQMNDEERLDTLLKYTILNEHDYNLYANQCNTEILGQNHNECKLIKFSNDDLVFNVNVNQDGKFVSFSMPYDEGWHVYLDGKKMQSSKINISLLGVKIPKGEHVLELRYVPKGWYLGLGISTITFLCVSSWMFKKKRHYLDED